MNFPEIDSDPFIVFKNKRFKKKHRRYQHLSKLASNKVKKWFIQESDDIYHDEGDD